MNPEKQPRFWQSLGLAFSLEAALIAGVLAFMLLAPKRNVSPVVPLVIETLPDTPRPEPVVAAAKLPPTPPPPAAKPMPVQKQVAARAAPETPLPPSKEPAKIAPVPVTAPTAVVAPATATTTTTVAVHPVAPPQVLQRPAQPVSDPSASYNAQLAASVQAAFQVPMAAQELGFKGRTRVEFLLRDGRMTAPRIIQGSGLGVADRAAIKAVESAVYPPPPEALRGREGIYQIWVACL